MSMAASPNDSLVNPWNSQESPENIAYGVSGSSPANFEKTHTFNWFAQSGARDETRAASISSGLYIKY
jgi:hypothetical protein